MKKLNNLFLMALLAVSLLSFQSCAEASKILEDLGLTNDEVVQGLKEALNVGTDTSITKLSASNGYFKDQVVKILLPKEAEPVYNVLSSIPGGQILLDNAVLAINRAAEDAAPEAKTIFVSAITGISIADGFTILKGGDTAATVYLSSKTRTPLIDLFRPKIQTSLSKPLLLNTSAEKAYGDLINAYNNASLGGILWPQIKTNSLSAHVTEKALDGLFVKVGDEERKIRRDPMHRVSEILQKVFGEN